MSLPKVCPFLNLLIEKLCPFPVHLVKGGGRHLKIAGEKPIRKNPFSPKQPEGLSQDHIVLFLIHIQKQPREPRMSFFQFFCQLLTQRKLFSVDHQSEKHLASVAVGTQINMAQKPLSPFLVIALHPVFLKESGRIGKKSLCL